MTASASGLEAQLRPKIDQLRAKADALATAVRERHQEAMEAQEVREYARAAALMSEVEQLNVRCNRANRAWLKLVVQVMNANNGGLEH